MSSSLWAFIARRIAIAPITLFAVLLITFALTQVAPGDPVRIISGQRTPDPERAELIREEFGLNGSFVERFGDYVVGFVQGDLGLSYFNRSPQRSVQELLGDRIWVSAQIGIIALFLIYLIGIPLGVYAAMNRGRWKDPALISGLMLLTAPPGLVIQPVLTWFLVLKADSFFGIFGFDVPSVWTPGDPASFIIPVTVLVVPSLAGMARFVRVSVLTVADEDYVRTAHAKGLAPRAVVYRHVLRNALLPLSTVMGLSVVGVVSGSIIVETLYGIPGVGAFIFQSITQRDFNVLLGFTMLVATLLITANLIVDIAYVFIDPRIRYTRRSA
ncbi:MAG: oligopeptide transport system permease protein [Chloroflexi bacterium]|jgi:ABC-type dipeptide/oligopeptide/nickel transport system permease component|nr:MAG: oligopeptide transport system permease protein [Chloroflexota bacterium]